MKKLHMMLINSSTIATDCWALDTPSSTY